MSGHRRACHGAVRAQSVGPTAAALLVHLAERPDFAQSLLQPRQMSQDLFEELLERARDARCGFREVMTPALRWTRLRAASGKLQEDYAATVQQLSARGPTPLVDLVEEAVAHELVRPHIERAAPSPRTVAYLRQEVAQSDARVHVRNGVLVLRMRGRTLRLTDRSAAEDDPQAPDLLSTLAHTWPVHGRGFAMVKPRAARGERRRASVALTEGFADALVAAGWQLDRDVRELEDLGGVASFGGQEAVVWIAVGAVILGGILLSIASKVDDPLLKGFLTVVGLILTIGGILVLVDSGAPVYACREDPDTGERTCGRI